MIVILGFAVATLRLRLDVGVVLRCKSASLGGALRRMFERCCLEMRRRVAFLKPIFATQRVPTCSDAVDQLKLSVS